VILQHWSSKASQHVSEGVHWRPKFLDEFLVLGDFCNAGYTSPPGSLLVIEGHIHVGIVFDLVKFVRGIVRDEKQIDLRWLNRCSVVRRVLIVGSRGRHTTTWRHGSRVECSGVAPSDQHRRVGVLDQLVEILYFLERCDLGVCRFRGNWVEVWVGHDGGPRLGEQMARMSLYTLVPRGVWRSLVTSWFENSPDRSALRSRTYAVIVSISTRTCADSGPI
jgi:hypothetical protein